MDSDVDLQLLMARYKEGDSTSAANLVKLLSPQLHRFFLMQFLSRRHADDLLQETWLRTHEARRTYRHGHPVLPWIYAIARNVRVDHYRKSHRTESLEERLDDQADIAGPGSRRSSDTLEFEQLLAALPESQREVIVMLKVSGMSLEEVSRATSCSVGSVKQKAHRAYESLRKGLSRTGPNDSKMVRHEDVDHEG